MLSVSSRHYVYVIAAVDDPGKGMFVGDESSEGVFVGGPGEGMFDRDEAGSDRASVTERSAQFIWLLVVVNAAIIAMSLLIAVLCCRRPRGGYVTLQGPYTYVPGNTHSTLHAARCSA